jgi:hypothetical protein
MQRSIYGDNTRHAGRQTAALEYEPPRTKYRRSRHSCLAFETSIDSIFNPLVAAADPLGTAYGSRACPPASLHPARLGEAQCSASARSRRCTPNPKGPINGPLAWQPGCPLVLDCAANLTLAAEMTFCRHLKDG